MTDRITPDARSKNMSAIRATRTWLEDNVTHELWKQGIRFRKNTSDLLGKPDIAIKKYKVVIFIDSCFGGNKIGMYCGTAPYTIRNISYSASEMQQTQ
jgi:DNA mismatch endonuclease Vsr